MAKPSSVTYEAVAQICRGLFADGKNPSFPLVYTALGNVGSAKIVQGFINDWRKDMAKAVGAGQPPEVAGVPPEAVSAWMAFLPKLWPALFQSAEALFNEQRDAQEAAMAAERAEMAAREQSFRDAANAAQALLQSYEADLTLLRSKNQDLNEKVADMTARLVDEGDARRRAESELVEVRRDVAEKEARFNIRIAEMESRMDTMRQEHGAALLAERRARKEELEMVHRTHDGDLADRNLEISALKGEMANAKSTLEQLRADRSELVGKAAQLDQENARLHASGSQLQEQLRAALQERAASEARSTAQEEFRKAETARAEDLGGQLSAVRQEVSDLQRLIREMKQSDHHRPDSP